MAAAITPLVVRLTSLLGDDLLPVKATPLSVGYDLRAPHDIYLPRGAEMFVNLGIVVDPRDFEGVHVELRTRSSSAKIQMRLANTLGTIDPDYCLSPEDSLRAWIRRDTGAPLMAPHGAPLPFEEWVNLFKGRLQTVKEEHGLLPPWRPDTNLSGMHPVVFPLEDNVPNRQGLMLLRAKGSVYQFPGLPVLMFDKNGPAQVKEDDLVVFRVTLPPDEDPAVPLFRRGDRMIQMVFIRNGASLPVQVLSPAEFFPEGDSAGRGGFGDSGVK